MTKHENDKFLLIASNSIKKDIIKQLDDSKIHYAHGAFFKTVPTDLSKLKLPSFEILVFYTPRDIDSLYQNFPDFEQGDIKIAVFGASTYQLAVEKGLTVAVKAPSAEHPSMSMALNSYLNTSK